eukprot:6185246-Pleurochrysis_carterae.AAC.1
MCTNNEVGDLYDERSAFACDWRKWTFLPDRQSLQSEARPISDRADCFALLLFHCWHQRPTTHKFGGTLKNAVLVHLEKSCSRSPFADACFRNLFTMYAEQARFYNEGFTSADVAIRQTS